MGGVDAWGAPPPLLVGFLLCLAAPFGAPGATTMTAAVSSRGRVIARGERKRREKAITSRVQAVVEIFFFSPCFFVFFE
jgi:hypothetical protein